MAIGRAKHRHRRKNATKIQRTLSPQDVLSAFLAAQNQHHMALIDVTECNRTLEVRGAQLTLAKAAMREHGIPLPSSAAI